MPEALSDHDGPYQHSWTPNTSTTVITTGWASPPNDLGKWGALVEAWARHLADRYGEDKVSTWPWEVWNEPDGNYWLGTIPQYCEMYDASARAVKRALPKARVGGPHTCGAFASEKARNVPARLPQACRRQPARRSTFSPSTPRAIRVIYDGHVRMGLHKQLRDIETSLAIINEFPTLTHLPVVIGESDPEGCAACSARVHPQNGYRNGPLYGVYVVESMLRTYELSRRAGIAIEGAVTWAFMFDQQPYFDGFRDLATNGIDKAVLNAFRMLGKLCGDWLTTESNFRRDIEDIMSHGVRGAARRRRRRHARRQGHQYPGLALSRRRYRGPGCRCEDCRRWLERQIGDAQRISAWTPTIPTRSTCGRPWASRRLRRRRIMRSWKRRAARPDRRGTPVR